MKYSIVSGEKREAQKSLTGICPNCERPTISKCGEKKNHHWAHKGKLECDTWWENETEWHRNWKAQFPVSWQEVIHKDEFTGERHIADVKTDQGWIIEFQHSYLKPEERRARNEFYKKIAWVVDGNRLKGDHQRVTSAINTGKLINQHVIKINPDACSLFKDWASLNIPVFFDFGGKRLVLLSPSTSGDFINITTFITKDHFVENFREPESQRSIEFMSFLRDFHQIVHQWNNPKQPKSLNLMHLQSSNIRRGPRINYIQKRRGKRGF